MYKTALMIVIGMIFVSLETAAQVSNLEYSAVSYMETADSVTKGPVYVRPGMERREYIQDGEKMVMILRHDKKLVWMLMTEEKMYMESKMPKEGRKDDLSAYKVDSTTIGPETVNGVKTTKSKIIMTGPNDEKMGGFWWASEEGVIIKMDAIAVEKGEKVRFTINLENLKFGKQKAELFEIPSDYTKMDMGGFGNMMSGSDDEDEDDQKEVKQPQEKGKKKGFSWKKALDFIQ